MRKRKRTTEYGSYIDEDTGEVTTVQTSKQAKRAHQKSGKWYKEPTEAELRAWDREEKRQTLADRAVQKEENKKINAAKRAEKERKEEQLKRQMFQAGKITFTQTLAKKDEDQKNLHSWFGGRPKASKLVTPAMIGGGGNWDENKEDEDENNQVGTVEAGHHHTTAADGEPCSEQAEELSQDGLSDLGDDIDNISDINDISEDAMIDSINRNQILESDQSVQTTTMDQIMDQNVDQNGVPDFDILEDDSADLAIMDQDIDRTITKAFKVPALPIHAQVSPTRLPLSPMSPSDVNVRNCQTTLQVSSFKSRLEKAKVETAPSTQAVRDILWGICTQDLADDMDDIDKENDEPGVESSTPTATSPVKSARHASPPNNASSASKVDPKPAIVNKSFSSNIDATDYDSIFFEIDVAEKAKYADDTNDNDDNFDDYGLDDATLLSLPPVTQLISSTCNSASSISALDAAPIADKSVRQPLTKTDSFALAFDGLDDDDLLTGLNEYEHSQKKIPSVSTATSIPVRTSLSMSTSASTSSLKKKRVLPWERPSWSAGVSGLQSKVAAATEEDDDGDTEMGTQDTQILSSIG